MADFNHINQFGSAKPVRSGEGASCAECEAMLMDALDGVLSAEQKKAFDRHISTCIECSQMLADAKRGTVLLEMLKSPRPEPSAALLERILSQTSGARKINFPALAEETRASAIKVPINGVSVLGHNALLDSVMPSKVLPFRPRSVSGFSLKATARSLMQPRLAMTAAMAFFSITLTLNLTGVHVTDLRASDLTPSNLKHSFYHANASVVRYYDNLRVVYELESRVNELKRSGESDNTSVAPKPVTRETGDQNLRQDKPRKSPKSSSGTSERRSPAGLEFKLAGYEYFPFSDATNENTSFTRQSNKLKETSQKGDLV